MDRTSRKTEEDMTHYETRPDSLSDLQPSIEELLAKKELFDEYSARKEAILAAGLSPPESDAKLRLLDYWAGQRILRIEFDFRRA